MPKGFFPEIAQPADGLFRMAFIDWEGFINHHRKASPLPFPEQTRHDPFTLSFGPTTFPTKASEKNSPPA